MPLLPYEQQKVETNIKGIHVKNIILVGGTLLVSTLIIWIVKR